MILLLLLCGVLSNFWSVFIKYTLLDSFNYSEGKKDTYTYPFDSWESLERLAQGHPEFFLCLFKNCAALCILISYASTDLFWENYTA